MTKALIITVRDWYKSQPKSTKIAKIHLIVGKFTCVEPGSLQFAFEVQTGNTFLEGVELVIQETPLIAFCHSCQQEYAPEIGIQYACPQCQSPMEDIRSGRELKIDHLEYSQPDAEGQRGRGDGEMGGWGDKGTRRTRGRITKD